MKYSRGNCSRHTRITDLCSILKTNTGLQRSCTFAINAGGHGVRRYQCECIPVFMAELIIRTAHLALRRLGKVAGHADHFPAHVRDCLINDIIRPCISLCDFRLSGPEFKLHLQHAQHNVSWHLRTQVCSADQLSIAGFANVM